jgi:two-component system sensor histidine kinase/response regulator
MRARHSFADGDGAAAGKILHGLRGSVGSLGARAFAAATVELEAALREARHDDARALFDTAAAELEGTTAAARAWLAGQEGAPALVAQPEDVRRWITLLEQRDLDATTVYESLRASLAVQLDARQQAAVAAGMAALDFDAVLAVLPATLAEAR